MYGKSINLTYLSALGVIIILYNMDIYYFYFFSYQIFNSPNTTLYFTRLSFLLLVRDCHRTIRSLVPPSLIYRWN